MVLNGETINELETTFVQEYIECHYIVLSHLYETKIYGAPKLESAKIPSKAWVRRQWYNGIFVIILGC